VVPPTSPIDSARAAGPTQTALRGAKPAAAVHPPGHSHRDRPFESHVRCFFASQANTRLTAAGRSWPRTRNSREQAGRVIASHCETVVSLLPRIRRTRPSPALYPRLHGTARLDPTRPRRRRPAIRRPAIIRVTAARRSWRRCAAVRCHRRSLQCQPQRRDLRSTRGVTGTAGGDDPETSASSASGTGSFLRYSSSKGARATFAAAQLKA